MLLAKARFPAIVLLAAAIYYVLVYYANGWIWGVAPGYEAFQTSLGRLAGARVWMHSVHAVALLLAAVPSALLLSWFGRPHAVLCAAIVGIITMLAAFAPTLVNSGSHLSPTSLAHMGVDSVKFVVIPVLLTWIANKLPSNNAMQRSSRVGTPLAGTGADADRLRSASGAPTARRR